LAGSKTDRLSLRGIVIAYSLLRVFVEWLDSRGVTRFDQATPESLDRYLDHVAGLERSPETKADYLHEVRRLWCYRDRLPEHLRLPATPPWDGEETQDLIDRPRAGRENTTPRIDPDTLQPLLMWSLRLVQDCSSDIIAAFAEHQRLIRRGDAARHRLPPEQRDHPRHPGWLTPVVHAWLEERCGHNLPLPGRRKPDGSTEVSWTHLERLFDTAHSNWRPGGNARELVLKSGLPIADDAYLDTPTRAALADYPYRLHRSAPPGPAAGGCRSSGHRVPVRHAAR
jgi:hypothetical protein